MKSKLISATILGGIFFQPLVVWALSETEVLDKLENVPTFSIIDQEGKPVPLKISPKNNTANNEPAEALVFINPQDADNMLQSLIQKKPELQNNLRVTPVSLSQVYQIMEEAQKNNAQRPPLEIVPIVSEVGAAVDLMTANGEKPENPEQVGIPLFYASIGEEGDYLIRQDINNDSYIPFYWTKKEVEEDIQAYQTGNPESQSQKIEIKTIPLTQFIQTLVENDNDTVKIMRIVASTEQFEAANRLLQ